MDVLSLVLAPVKVPLRIVAALDDLAVLADRARNEPDLIEGIDERLDALVAELATVSAAARELTAGCRDLTATAEHLDGTAQEIVTGGRDLTATAKRLDDDTETIADAVEPLGRLTSKFRAR